MVSNQPFHTKKFQRQNWRGWLSALTFYGVIFLTPTHELAVSEMELLKPAPSVFKSTEVRQSESLEYALTLEEMLDYDKALHELDQIISDGPTAALAPSIHYHRGRLHEVIGDDEQAVTDYTTVLRLSPALAILKDTLYRLGELHYLLGNYDLSQRYLTEATTYFPQDGRHYKAIFELAQSALRAKDWGRAVAMFDSFAVMSNEIADFGYYYQGRAYQGGGNYQMALSLYQKLLFQFPDSPMQNETKLSQAQCYLNMGNYTQALEQFKQLKKSGAIQEVRADFNIAVCMARQGNRDEAVKMLRTIVRSDPAGSYADDALNEIKRINRDQMENIDYYYAGLVRHHKRDFDKAAVNFKHFIEKSPNHELVDNARMMLARTYYRDNDYKKAIIEFSKFISSVKTSHGDYVDAVFLLGSSYARKGDYKSGIEQFDKVVTNFPDHDLADDALQELARAQESLKEFSSARRNYERLAKDYSRRQTSQKTQLEVGLNLFMEGDYTTAATRFETLVKSRPEPELEESATYWLAQCYFERNDPDTGQYVIGLLKEYYPYSYYLAFDRGWFNHARRDIGRHERSRTRKIQADDLKQLREWLIQRAPGQNANAHIDNMEKNPNFRKGTIFLTLGMRTEALQELKKAEDAFVNQPLALWRLLGFYLENAYFQRSIYCARKIADSVSKDPRQLPKFLNRFIYPVHYPELIMAAAEQRSMDPLLLCALIRQESMFESEAASSANAHGLMQVIPATGRYIAKSLGLEDFNTALLYSPRRSLEFGTWYFLDVLSQAENRVPRALAGYNGGPNNINRWVNMTGSGRDDLLSEKITFKETRQYVKKILNHYLFYEDLWGDYLSHG